MTNYIGSTIFGLVQDRSVYIGPSPGPSPSPATATLYDLVTQVYFQSVATQTFTAPDAYTFLSPSSSISAVRARCWAPGGGGTTATGSGGGGAFAQDEVTLVPGVAYNIVAPTAPLADISAADCTFNSPSVVAKGGTRGRDGGAGGSAALSSGSVKYGGANGTLSAGTTAGGGGGGSLAAAVGGAGGKAEGGVGQNGTTGRALGAGGGSTAGGQTGGGASQCRLDYFVPATASFARRMEYAVGRDAAAALVRSANMPAGMTAGEGLLMLIGVDGGAGAVNITVPDWSQLLEVDEGTGAVTAAAYWRVASGSSDTGIISSSTSTQTSFIVTRYADAGFPSISGSSGSSTNANPPPITPAGGSGNYHIVTLAAVDGGSTSLQSLPSGYSGGPIIYPSNDSGIILAEANTTFVGTTTDPAAYGSGNEQWVAMTIAIPYQAQ